jgi:hypothetical protein
MLEVQSSRRPEGCKQPSIYLLDSPLPTFDVSLGGSAAWLSTTALSMPDVVRMSSGCSILSLRNHTRFSICNVRESQSDKCENQNYLKLRGRMDIVGFVHVALLGLKRADSRMMEEWVQVVGCGCDGGKCQWDFIPSSRVNARHMPSNSYATLLPRFSLSPHLLTGPCHIHNLR